MKTTYQSGKLWLEYYTAIKKRKRLSSEKGVAVTVNKKLKGLLLAMLIRNVRLPDLGVDHTGFH